MSYQNSEPAPGSEPPVSTGFSAQSQMGLPEVLQMCCLSRRSGQITFRSGESYGFIFIQQGRVLHAMCGPLEGEDAIYTMLTWPGGGFTLDEDILPHKKTVTLTWEQLLFEGARRADEGLTVPNLSNTPVTTADPRTSTRTQESQPKVTVTRPDLPPAVFEFTQEYTHVGRTAGNELVLPYPSVSGRHCIFIVSGPDIVLRDLNSSNGTLVNGEAINETVLRPGDAIQIGAVQMKFEAGIKRPKLQGPLAQTSPKPLKIESSMPPMGHQTVKLPNRPTRDSGGAAVKDDSSFMKGETAISYDSLPKPATQKHKSPWPIIITSVVILLILGAACVYFFFPNLRF